MILLALGNNEIIKTTKIELFIYITYLLIGNWIIFLILYKKKHFYYIFNEFLDILSNFYEKNV